MSWIRPGFTVGARRAPLLDNHSATRVSVRLRASSTPTTAGGFADCTYGCLAGPIWGVRTGLAMP